MQAHHSLRIASLSVALLVLGALAGCASPPPVRTADRTAAPVRDARTAERPGPGRVAVLLPETGPHLAAATALRDGIMAAYFARPAAERPELRFHPAPADAFGTVAALREAAQAGATVAIGPLDKPAVAELAASPSLPIPVLALNQADSGARSPDLYQFSLAPEDEAEQVAERAWADGHRTAAVITPAGSWGDRVHASFQARWEALGGQISAHERYDAAPNDLGSAVATAIGADTGRQRHEELQQILGRRLEYAPAAPAEARCVFVAGTATKVRELRRELQRHAAGGLAAYGTSSAWTGDASPASEAGLIPIRVPDMPWLVADESQGPVGRATLAAAIPASAQSPLRRLYPMGIDSLDLLPQLARLRTPGQSFDGQTGNLSLDSQRRFHRRMVWVELGERGRRVLGYDSPARGPSPAGR